MVMAQVYHACHPANIFALVRVWQREGEESVGCDPDDHPTAKYIQEYAFYKASCFRLKLI